MEKFKVAYTQVLHTGEEQKNVTAIEYDSHQDAQRYADQLNDGPSYKDAIVIPARIKYTRADYLNHVCTHSEYYGQFITEGMKNDVVAYIGAERLNKSEDPHFNDIPLSNWDGCANSIMTRTVGLGQFMRAMGDYPTLSGYVCLCKQAALKYKNNQ